MARLKLFVFAVVVLGLGLARLYLSAPRAVGSAELAAKDRASQAGTALDGWMAERRSHIADLALAVAQKPEIAALVEQTKAKAEPPALETFNQLRDLVTAATPPALKGSVVLGWTNTAGALFARDVGVPGPQVPGIDPALAAPADATVLVEGVPYRLIAISVPGKVPNASPTTLVVGAPLFDAKVADDTARKLGLSAVAVLSAGQVVAAGGPEKGSLAAALKKVPANSNGAVESGSTFALGPVRFPVLSNNDPLGGQAPLQELVRRGLAQPGYEVAAIASTRDALGPLVEDQVRSVEFIGGGIVFFLLMFVVMGSGKAKKEKEDDGAWQPIVPPQPARQAVATPSVDVAAKKGDALELSQPVAAPETNPEDFDFGGALQQLPSASGPEDALSAAPMPAFDSERTTAYPTSLGGTTQLPALSEQAAQEGEGDHDSTRVAMIPSDLLRESVRRAEDVVIPTAPAAPLPTVAPPQVDLDEVHFQEVFQEFVTVRDQCGEGGENLTYEKFAAKLRKNRESLTQKYSCRTVRFQVYVKEGKAALKATPVRE